MTSVPKWRRYLRFWRPDPAADVDDELRTHLELRVAELTAQGVSAADAHARALDEFGDVEATRARLVEIDRRMTRRRARFLWWDALRADLRYALRGLRASPGLTVGVVLTLAVGIGAATTMYGVMHRLLLQVPPHVAAPAQVARLFFHYELPDRPGHTTDRYSYPFYEQLREHARTIDVAAYDEGDAPVGAGEGASVARVVYASDGYWRSLGARPLLGRTFTDDEAHPVTGARVAVLGHGYWQRRFGGDTAAIGATMRIKGQPYQVIGVAPPGFRGAGLEDVELFLPLFAYADGDASEREWHTYEGDSRLSFVGRLRPGTTRAAASADLTRIHRVFTAAQEASRQAPPGGSLAAAEPRTHVTAAPLQGAVGSDMRRLPEATVALWLVGIAVVLLVIACANIASLLLLRALRRRREIAVRLALGMSRARLGALLFTESAMLALLGGLGALLVTGLGGPTIHRLLLPGLALETAAMDRRMLGLAALCMVGTALVTGLVPVLQAGRRTVTALRDGAQHGTARRSPLHRALLVTQTALSVTLLIGAGLFLRSLHEVAELDLGLDTEHVLAVSIDFAGTGRSAREVGAFLERARERVAALPGVERTTLAQSVPLRSIQSGRIQLPGGERIRSENGVPSLNWVGDGFFETTGTRVIQGRGFTPADRGAHVVVVNEALARHVWPGRSPVGECVVVSGSDACATVIGVVETARRFRLREADAHIFYRPLEPGAPQTKVLLVRRAPGAGTFESTIRRALNELEPGLPYVDVSTIGSALDPQLRSWRLGAGVFTAFGLIAALLATVGLYGALAYAVTQRTREIGVRQAVGAGAASLVWLVVRDGLRVAAAGIALGVVLALVGGRWIGELLFEIAPYDAMVLTTVSGALLLVAVLASLVPARRASRVDPTTALRAE